MSLYEFVIELSELSAGLSWTCEQRPAGSEHPGLDRIVAMIMSVVVGLVDLWSVGSCLGYSGLDEEVHRLLHSFTMAK